MDLKLNKDLINQIKKGNKEAFVYIYEKHYKTLCKFGLQYINNANHVEEIVQDVICRLYEKRETLSIYDDLIQYLFRAIYNRIVNHLKKTSHKDIYTEYAKYVLNNGSADYSDPLEVREIEEKIHAAIEALPEKSKKIFEMSRFQGMKHAEISKKTGITIKGVEFHMTKSLKILKEKLKG